MQIKAKITNHARGVKAEEKAEAFLAKKGFKLLASRYKTKFGEIDLVMLHKKTLCFIEVKARGNEMDALESVTPRTRKRIEHSALHFLSENPEYTDNDMRFDVVIVTGDSHVQHLDNAWQSVS